MTDEPSASAPSLSPSSPVFVQVGDDVDGEIGVGHAGKRPHGCGVVDR